MRTRHRQAAERPAAVVDVDYDGYLELAAKACPGDCNELWRGYHPRALDELRMAYITRDEPVPYQPDTRTVRRAVAALIVRDGAWCQACQDSIRSAVGALPGLAEACLRIGGESGRLAPSQQLEVRPLVTDPSSPSPAFDMADMIERWPGPWARKLTEWLNDGSVVPASFGGLLGHWSQLMGAPFARPFGVEVLALQRRVELAAGVDVLVDRLTEPCPRCRRKYLERHDGADRVKCRACKGDLTMADYQRLVTERRATMKATG